jgi:hypothetical protein
VFKVDAPDSATVRIGDVAVGKGPWTTDTLAPGTYPVSASIPGRAECPTVTVRKTVAIRGDGSDTVSLQPRDCGWVSITVRPNGRAGAATFTLTNLDWRKAGELKFREPMRLLVPIGTHQLVVRAAYCADVRTTISVSRAQELKKTFIALCGEG